MGTRPKNNSQMLTPSPPNKFTNLVANTNQTKINEEKVIKILKYAQEKEQQLKIVTQNEKSAKKLAEKLKIEAMTARTLASQVLSTHNATQEVHQHLVDNVTNLAEKAQLAQYEASKASEERIKAVNSANVASQQAKIAKELSNFNNLSDMSFMKPTISNTLSKDKFKFVDNFQLKCPQGFVQQGTNCRRLIKIPNIEGFKNVNESNTLLIIIILILIIILAYRNKHLIK
jgi:hypothetical protein